MKAWDKALDGSYERGDLDYALSLIGFDDLEHTEFVGVKSFDGERGTLCFKTQKTRVNIPWWDNHKLQERMNLLLYALDMEQLTLSIQCADDADYSKRFTANDSEEQREIQAEAQILQQKLNRYRYLDTLDLLETDFIPELSEVSSIHVDYRQEENAVAVILFTADGRELQYRYEMDSRKVTADSLTSSTAKERLTEIAEQLHSFMEQFVPEK